MQLPMPQSIFCRLAGGLSSLLGIAMSDSAITLAAGSEISASAAPATSSHPGSFWVAALSELSAASSGSCEFAGVSACGVCTPGCPGAPGVLWGTLGYPKVLPGYPEVPQNCHALAITKMYSQGTFVVQDTTCVSLVSLDERN